MSNIGKTLIIMGIFLILTGGIVILMDLSPLKLGKLPGDIYIRRGKFTFFAPVVSMVVISAILTFIINFIVRFFK